MKNHEFMKFMFEVIILELNSIIDYLFTCILLFCFKFQNAFCLVFDLNGHIRYTSNEIKHLLDHDPVS